MASIAIGQPFGDNMSQRGAGSSAPTTTTKLRDSCTACATSKVKCSKEKPTCTRCARRGITCEYSASKRTGRTSQFASKHAAAQRARNAMEAQIGRPVLDQHVLSHYSNAMIPPAMLSPVSMSPSCMTRHSSEASIYFPGPGLQSPQNDWCSPGSLAQTTPDLSGYPPILTPVPTENEMDDLFSSMTSFPLQDGSERDVYLGQGRSDQSSVDFNAFDAFSVTGSMPLGQTMNAAVPDTCASVPTESILQNNFNTQDCSRAESTNSCITTALGFLTQLFPKASVCTLGGSQNAANMPTIDTVISENKHIIEVLTNMLDCPCSYDEYLVTLVSLVVLKVIAWYGAAARGTSPEEDNWNGAFAVQGRRDSLQSSYPEQVMQYPTVVGSYCVDRSEQVRMAAQLVLSELHRAQRLVNLLIKRFESIRQRRMALSSEACGNAPEAVLNSTSPLSAPTFDQLESDLRVRLRAVHLETIGLVRGGS